jgi:hypothetical protein
MSTSLERRLQRVFDRLPQPTREATRRARASALATLPPRQGRRGLGLVVVAAAAAVVLAVGAASLAATGNLHVRLGRSKSPPAPAPTQLAVPAGTNGVAVVAGGRLWLATRHGLRLEGMPVSAAELSPHALYAAAGVGSSLVALAPGHRAWTQDTHGRVAAISWSPDGLKIAYVVERRGGAELRLIEGDGDHDRLLARGVAVAKPSWRGDSLAVAYVGVDGRPYAYDLGEQRRRSFKTRSCGGPAGAVAYAPAAPRLAVAGTSGVAVITRWTKPPACVAFTRVLALSSLAWLTNRELVTSDNPLAGVGSRAAIRRFGWNGVGLTGAGAAYSHAKLLAIAAAPQGGRFVVALAPRAGVVQVFLASAPRGVGAAALRLGRPLLSVRASARSVSISWR